MVRILNSRWHTDRKLLIAGVGLSSDTKPTENIVSGSTFYEIDTGTIYRFDEVSGTWMAAESEIDASGYITPTGGSHLAANRIIEVIGIPDYINDPTQYSEYGITEKGWYAFARIDSSTGEAFGNESSVTGAAGYSATVGNTYVEVAIRFEVAAMSQTVTVQWGASTDTYIFKATDLAIRNLDYRTTFYVYDAAEFATWEYALTTDTTFSASKRYYTLEGGVYTEAEVTTGNPAIYYEAVDGSDPVTYAKTSDTSFQAGKTYYTTADGTTYTEATVTDGDPILTYYVQSKVTLAGMVRNVTYKLDTIIDCPMEIRLPEVADDGHGAWFEFHLQHSGSGSITLIPEATGVKAGTAGASAAITAGVNVVDLHYTDISGTKLWTLANVHSNIPA